MVSYTVTTKDLVAIQKIDFTSINLSVGLFALFTGVITYGFHRSLFYPIIEWLLYSERAKQLRSCMPLISASTIEILLLRWDYEVKVDPPILKTINARIEEWSNFVHQQYTSALCIGFGALVGVMVFPGDYVLYWPVLSLAILLTVSALVSNWRQLSLIEHVKAKTRPPS